MSYKLTRYLHREEDMYSLSDNNVYCIYEDHYGRIWVATFAGGINYITENEAGKTLFINHRNLSLIHIYYFFHQEATTQAVCIIRFHVLRTASHLHLVIHLGRSRHRCDTQHHCNC